MTAEGAVYRLPLTPADHQAVDDLVQMGTPVFGVVEYPHHDHRDTVPNHCPNSPEAATAAAAEYFAAMKKWDKQNVNVAEYIIHVEVPLVHVQHPVNWFIRLHLGYPGELDCNDRPLCEAASCILPAGKICETDVVTLQDFLGCGPWPAAQTYKVPKFYYKYKFGEAIKIYVNEDDGPMASSSKAENEGDYDLNPTPHLDTKQEAEAKALVLTAKSGDGTAKSQITKVLQGAQGKKRGKWHNGKPPQTDFETAVMQLWRSSDGPSKVKKKQMKKLAQERWHAEADTAVGNPEYTTTQQGIHKSRTYRSGKSLRDRQLVTSPPGEGHTTYPSFPAHSPPPSPRAFLPIFQ
ncbi:hypothetical protein BS47DRAFT_1402507 [Hydnum rufescens UP504]|uniref:Uncharacterized protein n=1 Tax=Hydnum rufescens UP504 TaxID=1448309 RepID=A0A9P6DMA1_9AGAM|nr:hypothetical protein BS47DRAFT_1402507 [Hydnum rufescens UP504]